LSSAHAWWLVPGVVGAFITSLYVLRAVRTIFLGAQPVGYTELRDARGVEWASFVILAAALVVLGVWPRLILAPLNAGVSEFLTRLGN
jgi:NADH-quinone oxidoreductase subunit M